MYKLFLALRFRHRRGTVSAFVRVVLLCQRSVRRFYVTHRSTRAKVQCPQRLCPFANVPAKAWHVVISTTASAPTTEPELPMCARIIETETAIEKQPNNCDNRDGHPHTIENKRARIDAAAAAPVQAGILYPEAGNVFVEKFDAGHAYQRNEILAVHHACDRGRDGLGL